MEFSVHKTGCRKTKKRIDPWNLSPDQIRDLERILATPVDYVGTAYFRRQSFMSRIMHQHIVVMPACTLKRQEEQILFQQLNYARYRMNSLRHKLLSRTRGRTGDITDLLSWHQTELQARNKIATGNMKLVFALARRRINSDTEVADLVSEGSMAMLRAIDHFDWTRGYKFSTYAWRAIERSFGRASRQYYRYRRLFPVQLDTALEKDDDLQRRREEHYDDQVSAVRTLMQANLADLSKRELSVVHLRFGLHQEPPRPLTLRQIGEALGLSKERVRQIQNGALAKLRNALELPRADGPVALCDNRPVASGWSPRQRAITVSECLA